MPLPVISERPIPCIQQAVVSGSSRPSPATRQPSFQMSVRLISGRRSLPKRVGRAVPLPSATHAIMALTHTSCRGRYEFVKGAVERTGSFGVPSALSKPSCTWSALKITASVAYDLTFTGWWHFKFANAVRVFVTPFPIIPFTETEHYNLVMQVVCQQETFYRKNHERESRF